MIEASELLHAYLHGVRSTTGASSATLFVPPSLSGVTPPLLLFEGDGPQVPELASLESATRWAVEVGSSLPGTQGAGTVASSLERGCLVRLDGRRLPAAPPRLPSDDSGMTPGVAWLGLVFPAEHRADLEALTDGDPPSDGRSGWRWLLELGGILAPHVSRVSAVLVDPITGLATRTGLLTLLSDEMERSRRDGRTLALLLVNPDDFPAINERFGREAGDRIVTEIAERIRPALRVPDRVFRYGGVVFAAALVDTPLSAAREVADEMTRVLSESAYLDGAVRLGFSTGLAIFDPATEPTGAPLDLIRKADQALNAAKRLGGGSVVDWMARTGIEEAGNFDRLNGIFTGNMTKDYRNMVMLWDTIRVVADHPNFEELAERVVDRVYSTFKPDRVGLFATTATGELRLVRGLTRKRYGSGTQSRVATIRLGTEDTELITTALATGQPSQNAPGPTAGDSAAEGRSPMAYAVPLSTGSDHLGCLFLQGREAALELDPSDLVFLRALATQLALALDRARLAELENKRQEQERRRMKAELNDLRQALGQAKLIFRSPEMDAAVATARRVAPTDATVLITGPSGTGKELLARTIHELSPRNARPMIVVDCGAIPSALIESELFGHEKGAYTGAEQRRPGRLAEADDGTLLLDEIAELPLEVQSRLLRFVQEKQFTPVGGSRPQRVDVRILAATNRELVSEVRAGRFREDLYYRLDVVNLAVPALRDRPEDILFLARHFLESFCLRYQKNVRSFSPEAEVALLEWEWPGNVRELQNRVMQAVILSEGEVIAPAMMGLEDIEAASSPRPRSRPQVVQAASPPPTSSLPGSSRRGGDLLRALQESLGREIESSLRSADLPAPPLGKWLGDDLVLAANDASGGVPRRAARLVGLPETTYRRRLRRAGLSASAGTAHRSSGWPEVARWLRELLVDDTLEGRNRLAVAETCLIYEILDRHPGEVKTGAALLGVSAPTYRHRVTACLARG